METQRYYVKELNNINSYKETFDYAIASKSTRGAKALATRAQTFKGTVLILYLDYDCKKALSYKINKTWVDYSYKTRTKKSC